ncbi:MAG TPA: hypothetical protein VNO52_13090, partial [Methylomirabilota bacterium]|nr:hypothetical protein [Methylomirabilota bacterium]
GRSQGRFRQAAPALAQWALARPGVYALPASLPLLRLGETIYRAPTPPAEMSAFTAGVLGVTSRLVDAESEIRRRNAERLLRRVEQRAAIAVIQGAPGGVPGYLRLPLRGPGTRDPVLEMQGRRLGVMPGYPRPLARLAGFAERVGNAGGRFPGAELLASRLVTVPAHGKLRRRDLRRLEAWLEIATKQ